MGSEALVVTVAAQEGEVEEPAPVAGSPQPGLSSKLSFHGYLTQASAETDGLGVFGATEDGTTDYRTAALQLSYDYDPATRFVIQLAHQRIGDAARLADDILLDWAFFQRRIGADSAGPPPMSAAGTPRPPSTRPRS